MRRTQEIVEPDGTVVRRKPVVGDMRWDGEEWQRWSGRRWTRAAYAVHVGRLRDATPFAGEPDVDEARRHRAVELAVEDQVASNGATVVFEGPNGVVLGYRRRVSHVFHAVMTLLTAGLWAIVWVAAIAGSGEDRIRLEVDRWGNVWARPVATP